MEKNLFLCLIERVGRDVCGDHDPFEVKFVYYGSIFAGIFAGWVVYMVIEMIRPGFKSHPTLGGILAVWGAIAGFVLCRIYWGF